MSIKLLLFEPNLACSTLIVSLQMLKLICKFVWSYAFLYNVVEHLRELSELKCNSTSINMVSVSNAQKRGFFNLLC
jgi:hypothetical protein